MGFIDWLKEQISKLKPVPPVAPVPPTTTNSEDYKDGTESEKKNG